MQLTTVEQDRRPNHTKKALAVRSQPQAVTTGKPDDRHYEQACHRMQDRLGLRFQTVHLGLTLFRRCYKNIDIPLSALVAVCIFLAMKYQEIYPPSLKQILDIACINIDLPSYRKYERAVFLHLEGNLNVDTGAEMLQRRLGEGKGGKGQRMMGYFLFELALISPNIVSRYSHQEIVQAIARLLMLQGGERERENEKEGSELPKLLLQLRGKSNKAAQMIVGKYRHARYMQIACMPLP